MITGDIEMASPSTSTARQATESNAESSLLGGIEALKLKVGPVRRNLFGPVDHEQLQRDFQRLLCMSVEVANKRWNFDFQKEMPGEGANVEWEELKCHDVPSFYRNSTVKPVRKPFNRRRTASSLEGSSGSSSGSSSSSSSGSGDEYLEVTTRGCYRIKLQSKRKQASITDFFKVKKRKLMRHKQPSRQ